MLSSLEVHKEMRKTEVLLHVTKCDLHINLLDFMFESLWV